MNTAGELLAQPCAAPRVSNGVSATGEALTSGPDTRTEQAGQHSTWADGPRSANPHPAWQRVLARSDYDEATGCFRYGGQLTNGYGRVQERRASRLAHRVIFAALVGPIPDGLHVGHRCHDLAVEVGSCEGGTSCLHRRCVLPAHLEVQTQRVNTLAGLSFSAKYARATACPAGHPWDGPNMYLNTAGARVCRTCKNAHKAAYRLRARQVAPGARWHQVDLLEVPS